MTEKLLKTALNPNQSIHSNDIKVSDFEMLQGTSSWVFISVIYSIEWHDIRVLIAEF